MISSQILAQLQGILLEKETIVKRNEERINQLIDEIASLRNGGVPQLQEESSDEEDILDAEENDDVAGNVVSKHPTWIGEFALRDASSLIPVEYAKPYLKTELFDLPPNAQPGLPMNLLQGVEHFFCVEHKNERFPAFLRWIQESAPPNQSLKEFLRGSEFVSLRGTLNRLPKGRPVVCCKFQGVIFLCENEWTNYEPAKNLLYAHIMMREYVSEIRTDTPNATDKTDEFYMVFGCGETTETSARICYATKTDCVDDEGKPVQIPPFVSRSQQATYVYPLAAYLDRRSAVVIAKRFANFSLSEVSLEESPQTEVSDERAYKELHRLQQTLAKIRQHFEKLEDGEYVSVKSGKMGPQFSRSDHTFLSTSFQRRFKQCA